jgi:hypothetical protein
MQRRVPLLFFVAAHLALASAAAVTLWDPSSIAGFFYHPKMIGVVHSLTLGWISSSLLGLLYLAGPRLGVRAAWPDAVALGAWVLGASGLASHFWIEEFNGMTWSAGLAGTAVLFGAGRFGAAAAASDLPAVLKLQIQLAWLNLVGTAFIGILLGINKTTPVLPGYSLHNVYAHAHLAAIGWAFLLLVATAHLFLLGREERLPWPALSLTGTLLTQLGATGVFVSLLTGEPWAVPFGVVAGAGMTLCLAALARHALSGRPSFRPAWLLIGLSPAWLLFAAFWYLGSPRDPVAGGAPETLMVYGVAGLLGGLGQAVAGWSRLRVGRSLEWPAVLGWIAAVPLLAAGLGLTHTPSIRVGAAALLAAVLCGLRGFLGRSAPRCG